MQFRLHRRTLFAILAVSFSFASFVAASLVSPSDAFCQDVSLKKAAGESSQTDSVKPDGFAFMLNDWEAASFGGDGAIEFEKTDKGGQLVQLNPGDPLTGVRWTGPVPRQNYEIRLEGRRVDGFDFFTAVTFPVGDEHCSFVLGGWGGGLVGISSIDGNDASNNETTTYKEFKNGQWYKVRIRVTEDSIVCWIDDQEYARVERGDHEFDIRFEMDPCLPLGIANFMCQAEVRNIQLRKLDKDDQAEMSSAKATQTKSTEPVPATESVQATEAEAKQ